jgi:hypothetical protein
MTADASGASGQDASASSLVSSKLLLALYALVPAALLLLALDQFVFGLEMKERLPRFPQSWAWWVLVFNVPHIVASYFSFCDKQYLQHYKKQLLLVLSLAPALAIGIPALVGPDAFLAFFAVATMYHVLAQQLGISLSLAKIKSSLSFSVWKLTAISGSCCMYLYLFSPSSFNRLLGKATVDAWIPWFVLGCFVLATLASVDLIRKSRTRVGRWFIGANVAMLLTSLLAWRIGYPVFVVVIPRVIHDVTAFSVYIVHDRSRNGEQCHNPLYWFARKWRLPFVVYTPMLAMAINYTVLSEPTELILTISYTLALGHYATENFIWRSGSLHRRHLGFS